MGNVIPKLRFKEFMGGWQPSTMDEYTTSSAFGPRFSSDLYNPNGNVVTLRTTDMNDNGDIDYTNAPLAELSLDEFEDHILKEGDLVISRSGTIGVTGLFETCDLPVIPGAFLIRFRLDTAKAYPSFVRLYLNSTTNRKKMESLSAGGVQKNLTSTSVLKMNTFLPSLPEQEKIASFLSAVDEKIQKLTRKKELLEQYKKGVMQQLFSSSELGSRGLKDDRMNPDHNNPSIHESYKSQLRQLRFKDENGKAYPKWEETLFENIYSFYSTNSLSRDKLNYEGGSVKNIHYGDIHTKFRSQFVVNEEYVPYINGDIDLSKMKEENYCREGDLVIADASEDYNDIGKSIELIKLKNEKVVAGLHTFLARPDLSKIKIGFSGYLVQASYVRMQVKKIAQGTKVLSLSPNRLGKVKLFIPSKAEQNKIASFLSALDAKIESVAKQIAHTQTFKKGLLQQMFV